MEPTIFPTITSIPATRNVSYGRGWTEWELVKAARPRFPDHRQPRVPLWGYLDEVAPAVMEKKIAVAADHGIHYWIFDWYWYNDGPFLNRCLEKGYFGAKNNEQVKFCCMWANHDWIDIFPYRRGTPRKVLYPGAVTRQTFETIADHVVRRYFKHPAHWTVDGRPYFSVYDLGRLLRSFGGVKQTRAALDAFRKKTEAAGFPGLHLNAVVWGRTILPGEGRPADPAELVRQLGFDSVTSYVWVHHVRLPKLKTDYGFVQQKYFDYWRRAETMFDVPYYPNVTIGWDPSPRCHPDDEYGNFGYPFTNTITGNTPQQFREALASTRKRLEQDPNGPRILNINSWNEWTEGSYLEPDTHFRLGYLEAVKSVFGRS
ncbi:MAG: hypothetical protein GXP27_02170 [Planctomycetes bacterium]|nr:hypothetical protein [Planctomycetota bacterium]